MIAHANSPETTYLHPRTRQPIDFTSITLEEMLVLLDLTLESLVSINTQLDLAKSKRYETGVSDDRYPRLRAAKGHMGRLHQRLLRDIASARKNKRAPRPDGLLTGKQLLYVAIKNVVSESVAMKISEEYQRLKTIQQMTYFGDED
jgi:hypothetical protein